MVKLNSDREYTKEEWEYVSEGYRAWPPESFPEENTWSIYLAEGGKVDKALVENWKGDMDGILIFSGLFSAVITAFIIDAYKTLQQDTGSMTVTLLAQISLQLTSMSNGSHIPILPPSNNAIYFYPSGAALRVNACWFLSLSFSLTCALMATLVQQWARQYTQGVGRLADTEKRAQIRMYLFHGLQRFRVSFVVETIPAFLHLSVFLFLAGLVQFLYTINSIIASITLVTVGVIIIFYLSATIMSALYVDCPYRTSLSLLFREVFDLSARGLAWLMLLCKTIKAKNRNVVCGTTTLPLSPVVLHDRRPVHPRGRDISHRLEEEAQCGFAELQSDALQFTLDNLRSKNELIRFFESLPRLLMTLSSAKALRLIANKSDFIDRFMEFFSLTHTSTRLASLRLCFSVISHSMLHDILLNHPDFRRVPFRLWCYAKHRGESSWLSVHYTRCIIAIIAHLGILPSPVDLFEVELDTWEARILYLCQNLVPSESNMPRTEGGAALEDTLIILSKGILSGRTPAHDYSIEDKDRLQFNALTKFFKRFHGAEREPDATLSLLGTYYILRLLDRFSYHDFGHGAVMFHDILQEYIRGASDLGQLKKYFERLAQEAAERRDRLGHMLRR